MKKGKKTLSDYRHQTIVISMLATMLGLVIPLYTYVGDATIFAINRFVISSNQTRNEDDIATNYKKALEPKFKCLI